MLNIQNYSLYDQENKILYGTHYAGFYSCINTTRISVFDLASRGMLPATISFKDTLMSYKSHKNEDLYPLLYKQNSLIERNTNFDFKWFCPTLIKYSDIDFKNFVPLNNFYFCSSNLVKTNTEKLLKKYNIDLSNTIAVLHRGTDKWREATLVDPQLWLNEIQKKITPSTRILIQTDEESTKNFLVNALKDKCFIFDEMMFNNTYVKPNSNYNEWAVNFESIMRIIANCSYVITHSGNCGIVPILYREGVNNVTQLLCNGTFQEY